MDIELLHQPGNAVARITLAAGESCTAQAGSMLAMSGNMQVNTTTHKRGSGSLLKAARRLLAGESLFLNHFQPQGGAGEVFVGAALPGDMMVYTLEQENLIVQGGAYIACEQGVEIDMSWQGMKTLLSGEALFWVKLSGSGKVVLTSFGEIYPLPVDGEVMVDTGHVVAFSETLDFSLDKAGGSWWHSFLGGEGFVLRFRDKGTVWCQSHNPSGFGSSLSSSLKPRAL